MRLCVRSIVLSCLLLGCGRGSTTEDAGLDDAGGTELDAGALDAGATGDDAGPFEGPAVCARFGPFGEPVLLDLVNSDAADTGPWINGDGTVLYFCSGRDAPAPRVYRASRPSPGVAFGLPELVSELDLPMRPSDVALSEDELEIYFRGDGPASSDLFVATRTSTDEPFGTPEALPFNDPDFADSAPTVRVDGLEILFTRGVDNVYRATRASRDEPFGPASLVPELVSPGDTCCPSMMHDGLTIFFDRMAGDSWDVYTARRPSVDEPFAEASAVAEVNHGLDDIDAAISGDGRFLVFSSARGMGGRSWELWIAERDCLE